VKIGSRSFILLCKSTDRCRGGESESESPGVRVLARSWSRSTAFSSPGVGAPQKIRTPHPRIDEGKKRSDDLSRDKDGDGRRC